MSDVPGIYHRKSGVTKGGGDWKIPDGREIGGIVE